jgi:hypothetical protein
LPDGLKSDYFSSLHICAALGPHNDGTHEEGDASMASPRWLAGLTMPIVVGAVLVANAAISGATPHDDEFLARLRGIGFAWPPQEDTDVVNMAHQICIDRWNGATPDGACPGYPQHLGPERR